MSDSWLLIVAILVVWVGTGVGLSVVMGRRGHDPFAWAVLGTLLGPLAVLFAVLSSHDIMGPTHTSELAAGRPGSGPVDVVVGFDDSLEARAAVAQVELLLGPRLGRMTLAAVIPYGAAEEDEDRVRAMLQKQAERMDGVPALDVVEGHPSAALERLATEGGYHLLVIGTRGSGRSKAVLGSAAAEVARQTAVPVLLVGANGANSAGSTTVP